MPRQAPSGTLYASVGQESLSRYCRIAQPLVRRRPPINSSLIFGNVSTAAALIKQTRTASEGLETMGQTFLCWFFMPSESVLPHGMEIVSYIVGLTSVEDQLVLLFFFQEEVWRTEDPSNPPNRCACYVKFLAVIFDTWAIY